MGWLDEAVDDAVGWVSDQLAPIAGGQTREQAREADRRKKIKAENELAAAKDAETIRTTTELAEQNERRRAATGGRASTLLTSGLGVTSTATTARRTLLGS